MLTVIGFPRSGTNFLTRMLAHYIDGPDVEVWPGTPAHPKVNKIHWAYQDDGSRPLVYIYRDPRDCALSGWEYVKNGFTPELGLWEFLEGPFSGYWDLWPSGWRDHTLRWLDKDLPTVCYETLCADRWRVLQKLIEELGVSVDENCIAHAIAHSYLDGKRRMGNAGRWVNELPTEAAAWLDEHCGMSIGR